jgi:hypothetical protein
MDPQLAAVRNDDAAIPTAESIDDMSVEALIRHVTDTYSADE